MGPFTTVITRKASSNRAVVSYYSYHYMNLNRRKSRYFDAGRAEPLPESCLLRGRNPDSPAAQASPHTPALDCGRGRRHPPARGGRGAKPLPRLGTAGGVALVPRRSITPDRLRVSWRLRSVTDDAGRRVITLSHRRSLRGGQLRDMRNSRGPFAYKRAWKMLVRFAPEGMPLAIPVVRSGGPERFHPRAACRPTPRYRPGSRSRPLNFLGAGARYPAPGAHSIKLWRAQRHRGLRRSPSPRRAALSSAFRFRVCPASPPRPLDRPHPRVPTGPWSTDFECAR